MKKTEQTESTLQIEHRLGILKALFKPTEFPLDQVSAVRLDTHTDSDGDKTYQIILTVSSKQLKLPSSSSQSKEFNLAQEIKDFLGL